MAPWTTNSQRTWPPSQVAQKIESLNEKDVPGDMDKREGQNLQELNDDTGERYPVG